METVKVKYLTDIEPIKQAHTGEWYDLRAAETVEMKKGEYKLIPIGVAVELPDGFEAHVVPRSSTFNKYHILQANSFGVIDNAYRGQWMFPAYAIDDTTIKKNERICQFRIFRIQPQTLIKKVDELSESERGDGGFGSSGRI